MRYCQKLRNDYCTSDEKRFLKIENKRILLQTTSFNFQKKNNFIKITLLTVAWTKIIIVDGSTFKIFAFYQPYPFQFSLVFEYSSIKNLPGCLFIRTFFTEEFLYPPTYVNMLECLDLTYNFMHTVSYYYNNNNLKLYAWNCMWDQDTPDFMEI